MTLSFIGNLVIALLLILLLWYVLKMLPFLAPYGKVVDIGCAILAVIVVIGAFTGANPIRIVSLDKAPHDLRLVVGRAGDPVAPGCRESQLQGQEQRAAHDVSSRLQPVG